MFFDSSDMEYRGNTACSVLDIDGHKIVLDCGTGLMQFYYDIKDEKNFKPGLKLDVLLSRLHLAHLIGFSSFSPILSPDSDIRIFTKSRNDAPLVSQVFGIFRPPYWPMEIAGITRAKVTGIIGGEPFMLNESIKITPFLWDSCVENETVSYRIDLINQTKTVKSVVYLPEYEINKNSKNYKRLINFCRNADLVLFAAAYLQKHEPAGQDYGHYIFEAGIALAEDCSCRKMIFPHICMDCSKQILNLAKGGSDLDNSKYSIAFDGMETDI